MVSEMAYKNYIRIFYTVTLYARSYMLQVLLLLGSGFAMQPLVIVHKCTHLISGSSTYIIPQH